MNPSKTSPRRVELVEVFSYASLRCVQLEISHHLFQFDGVISSQGASIKASNWAPPVGYGESQSRGGREIEIES